MILCDAEDKPLDTIAEELRGLTLVEDELACKVVR